MKFLFTLLFIFTLTILSVSFGALDESATDLAAPDKRALMAQGQIMSVRVVPADKSAKLFVLGKKALDYKAGLKPKVLQVTAFNSGEEEELHLTPEGDYYTINNPQIKKPYSLRVRTQLDKQEEKFEIKVPTTTIP